MAHTRKEIIVTTYLSLAEMLNLLIYEVALEDCSTDHLEENATAEQLLAGVQQRLAGGHQEVSLGEVQEALDALVELRWVDQSGIQHEDGRKTTYYEPSCRNPLGDLSLRYR